MAQQGNQNQLIEEPMVSESSDDSSWDSESDWGSDDSSSLPEEIMDRIDWEIDYLEYQRKFDKYYDDGRAERMEEVFLDREEVTEDLESVESVTEESTAQSMCAFTSHKNTIETISDLLNLQNTDLHFNWAPIDSGTFKIAAETFRSRQNSTVKPTSPLEAFLFFWDDNILNFIVKKINEKFVGKFSETDVNEVLMIFAFYMALGSVGLPTIESCFEADNMCTVAFFKFYKKYMTEKRFLSLESAWFSGFPVELPSETFFSDYVLEYINKKFQEAYIPGQDVFIDESQTLSKGNFKYMLPNTTVMKSFQLAESGTEYTISLIVYAEKDVQTRPVLASTTIVLNIIKPFLNLGHTLFLDHRLNSPILARFLKKNGTDCVGTIKEMDQLPNMPKESDMAKYSGDLVLFNYVNKKSIPIISTCHDVKTEMAETGTSNAKPSIVKDYNKGMGKVDLDDDIFQYLNPYAEETKRKDWYKALFKQCLNTSINNARVIFNAATGKNVDLADFRKDLLSEFIEKCKPGFLDVVDSS